MMMMMMMGRTALRCAALILSLCGRCEKLLKQGGGGYLRSIFPSHWSLSRSCSDKLRWHIRVSGDKKKSNEPRRRNTSCWRADGDFPFDGRCASASLSAAGSICPNSWGTDSMLSCLSQTLTTVHVPLLCDKCLNKMMKEQLGASAPLRTAHRSAWSVERGAFMSVNGLN